MTARMKNPSVRAQKMHDLTPKADFSVRKGGERGANVARARGMDTSTYQAAELIDKDKPLTEKQKAFVKAWAEGDTLSNSCLRAGYADDGLAYRLARMPNILALKSKYEAEWQATRQITREKVMDGMLEAIEMAKLMSEPATMVAGWREIGKICGFYAPVEHKVRVDVTGNVVLDRLNSLSDAELLKIITEGTKSALPVLEHGDSDPD